MQSLCHLVDEIEGNTGLPYFFLDLILKFRIIDALYRRTLDLKPIINGGIMKWQSVFAVSLLSLLFVFSIAHAERTIWYVHPDSTLNTIQAGLDSCADNDIVLVAPGTYIENITWPNMQGIQLLSVLGAEQTIIDGDSVGSVISIMVAVDTTTIINGFTIQNGYATYGAGLLMSMASPIISNNVITGNEVFYGGGGIYTMTNSSPVIRNNTISDNVANYDYGGGIACNGGSPTISENTITDNIAQGGSGGFGGGIFMHNASGFMVSNTIMYNSSFYGAGIYCNSSSSPMIDSCIIAHNYGDGVYGNNGATPELHYNDIFDNEFYGVMNASYGDTIDATYNWWGDPSGPGGMGPGTGDEVSNRVLFDPWLGGPVGIYEYKKPQKAAIALKTEPNPFKHKTTIYYALEKPGMVSLKVYDQTGRLVRILESGIQQARNYTAIWDGCDETRKRLPTGIYFIRLNAGDITSTKKVILIR